MSIALILCEEKLFELQVMSKAAIGVDQRLVVKSSGVSSLTSKLNWYNMKIKIQQEQTSFIKLIKLLQNLMELLPNHIMV